MKVKIRIFINPKNLSADWQRDFLYGEICGFVADTTAILPKKKFGNFALVKTPKICYKVINNEF